MPWKVSGVVEQRQRFLREYETGEWTMTELCRAYEISRPTGYALWHRYGNEGEAGLEERSRAPARHPNQTPPEIEEQVLGLGTRASPNGAKEKLRHRLRRDD
jgi:transposase-like protein